MVYSEIQATPFKTKSLAVGCRQMVCYKVSISRTNQHLNHRQGCVQVSGISRTSVRHDETVLVGSVRAGSRTEQQ